MIRISTLARLAEDATISVASNIARRTKDVAHSTSMEYRARVIARAAKAAAKQEAAFAAMTPAQRKEAQREAKAIEKRAAELIKARTK